MVVRIHLPFIERYLRHLESLSTPRRSPYCCITCLASWMTLLESSLRTSLRQALMWYPKSPSGGMMFAIASLFGSLYFLRLVLSLGNSLGFTRSTPSPSERGLLQGLRFFSLSSLDHGEDSSSSVMDVNKMIEGSCPPSSANC
ncbi:hypothetical protein TIFTF001_017090 [Ficus carica]|uniref:Uncharacterized protein n=1 Tax=Ficus carica TaxID=3494 RepID=A0AA88A1H8_FICCA|nr:hypothetical protein TIFTF001_017090 [Ficus carica]